MRKSAHHQNFVVSLLTIVVMMLTMFGQSCNGQKDAGYKCPTPSSISPCTCSQYVDLNGKLIDNSIAIDCESNGLNDDQMSTVLNAFLSDSQVSPVIKISASRNSLTRIPQQFSEFPRLSIVDLGYNKITEISGIDKKPFLNKNSFTNESITINLQLNEIVDVPSGIFNFPNSPDVTIVLGFNKIVSIASDAFRFPSATKVFILLHYNKIGLIPGGVFHYPNALSCYLYLYNNEISAISPSAFNLPLATDIGIGLSSNGRISLIPIGVFNFPSATFIGINLAENRITEIPCGAFNYPLITRQANIGLDSNQITTIPSCAFNFPSSHWVEITLNNNSITTISPGAFNFPSAISGVRLKLQNNRISSIPPNSFTAPGQYDLLLQNNQLKRFESAVFKTPAVNNLQGNYYSIAIDGNPIDCLTDPCHLAWILQSSNRNQLLSRISGPGICSSNGGSPFFDLINSNYDFSKNCPCSYNY